MTNNTSLCLLFSALGFSGVTMEQRLKAHLFNEEFDPTVRPVADVNDNVTVYIDISLNHLVDLVSLFEVCHFWLTAIF